MRDTVIVCIFQYKLGNSDPERSCLTQSHLPSGTKIPERGENPTDKSACSSHTHALALDPTAESFPRPSSPSAFQVWDSPPETFPDSPG